jgi:hypothetical protein
MEAVGSSESSVETSIRMYGAISQKIVLIITAVRWYLTK